MPTIQFSEAFRVLWPEESQKDPSYVLSVEVEVLPPGKTTDEYVFLTTFFLAAKRFSGLMLTACVYLMRREVAVSLKSPLWAELHFSLHG